MRDIWRLLMFPALGAAIVAGCADPNVYEPPPPPEVTVAKPLRQTVTSYLEETGTTEAVEMVDIRARVRGFLEKVNFEPGAEVRADDILYVIQQREFKAKVDSAQAELDAQTAKREKAKIEKERQLRLKAQDPGATSEVAVVSAVAEFDSAAAGVQAAQAALDQAQLDLDYTEVTTPIDGRVGKTLIKAGNLVGDSEATHLTTVIKYDPIYVNFNISERALLDISERANRKPDRNVDETSIPVELRRAVDKGFPFKGNVNYADLAVDQSTGTFLIRGIIPNPDRRIVPGLFVRVRIPLGTIENAVLVPERALGVDQAGRYALVVNSDKVVERRNVVVGAKYEDLVVVESGLVGDERIIVDGLQRARPGAEVAPKETELAALATEVKTVESGSESPLEDQGAQPEPAGEPGSDPALDEIPARPPGAAVPSGPGPAG